MLDVYEDAGIGYGNLDLKSTEMYEILVNKNELHQIFTRTVCTQTPHHDTSIPIIYHVFNKGLRFHWSLKQNQNGRNSQAH